MITFGKAVPAEREALKVLWLEAFEEDSSEDVDGFLDMFFADGRALVAREDSRIVSMLFLLPQTLCFGASTVTVGYVYGGATATACRGRGYYRQLLDHAARFAAENGMAGLFLHPADDRLADSYRRMGFTVPMYCGRLTAHTDHGAFLPLSATDYGQRRRRVLSEAGEVFIDWDDTTLAYAQRWCRTVGTATSAALIGDKDGELFAWEVFGSLPSDTLSGRTVGNDETVGLMRLFDGAPRLSNVYMGYGLE